MRRIPITDLYGNLLYTEGGSVWAGWRIDALPYGPLHSEEAKEQTMLLHQSLFRALSGEFLLLGVLADQDPRRTVESMINDIDLNQRPRWAHACELTLDYLEELTLGERHHWLYVPLANRGLDRLVEPVRSAVAMLKRQVALPRSAPGGASVQERLRHAEEIRLGLPKRFNAQPVTAADTIWLYLHALTRGHGDSMPAPVHGDATVEQLLTPRSSTVLPSGFILDEGGLSDFKRRIDPVTQLRRRFVKVQSGQDDADWCTSYQTHLTVANIPEAGVPWPGGEWIGRIDDSGVDVDWAIRGSVRSRQEVVSRNRRATIQLEDQINQLSGEELGGNDHLRRIADAVREYQARIENDKLEVEVDASAIFTVAAGDADAVRAASRQLQSWFADFAFKVVPEIGAQAELWWAGLPGVPTGVTVRQTSQIAPSSDWAKAVPVVTARVGDASGFLLGMGTEGGRPWPSLLDLVGATRTRNRAIAVGASGEQGGGKSFFLKAVTYGAIEHDGARVHVIDPTRVGEWAKFARVIPDHQVVDMSAAATLSIDPLRIFPAEAAARVTQSFLTPLLQVTPMSAQGLRLSELLDRAYLAEHGLGSLGALERHLQELGVEDPLARELWSRMRAFSRTDIGRVVFDDELPVVNLKSTMVVYRTANLELPSDEELNSAQLYADQGLEKIFGRAAYSLLVAIAEEDCFADTRELVLLVLEEISTVITEPGSRRKVTRFVLDGRKHFAGILLAGQDAEAHFGDEVMRGLIPYRAVFRCTNPNIATRAVRWLLGLPVGAEVPAQLVEKVTSDLAPILPGEDRTRPERLGEALVSDFSNNVGPLKVLGPMDPEVARAIGTTPPSPELMYTAAL